MTRSAVLLLTILGSVARLAAQSAADYEKVMVPVVTGTIHGAFGSTWTSRVLAFNEAPVPVWVLPPATAPAAPLEPHRALLLPIRPAAAGEPPGRFLYIERAHAQSVHIAAHVIAEPGGGTVELDVVPAGDFRAGTVHLLGLPASPELRRKVRIYDDDGFDGAEVTVRVYGIFDASGLSRDALLEERRVVLRTAAPSRGEFAYAPAYAEYDVAPANVAQWSLLRVEIEPLSAGLRIWSFATATNNVTQEVTTFTPH